MMPKINGNEKVMVEIERKWLIVAKDAEVLAGAYDHQQLAQGYIDAAEYPVSVADGFLKVGVLAVPVDEKQSERIRELLEKTDMTKGVVRWRVISTKDENRACLTLKSPGDLERMEEEVKIPMRVADELRGISYSSLKKERFKIKDGEYTLEVDVYDPAYGFKFSTIEVEFKNKEEAERYTLPPEILDLDPVDVTLRLAFRNNNLATAPKKAKALYQKLAPR